MGGLGADMAAGCGVVVGVAMVDLAAGCGIVVDVAMAYGVGWTWGERCSGAG